MIAIYYYEEEAPLFVREHDWYRDDYDFIIVPNDPDEISRAAEIANRLAVCEYKQYTAHTGQVFFVTYHA